MTSPGASRCRAPPRPPSRRCRYRCRATSRSPPTGRERNTFRATRAMSGPGMTTTAIATPTNGTSSFVTGSQLYADALRRLVSEPRRCRSSGGADRAPDLPVALAPHPLGSGVPTLPGGTDEHWRYRVAADVDRPGHDHAAGPRAVLRRPRPPQERPVDDHAQLLRPGPRQRRLGHRRLLARVRA